MSGTAVKLPLYRAGFWLWFTLRGYYLWSRFWRFVLERKYRGQPLTQYANIGQLESALGSMKWTEDPIKGAFDVVSTPEKVEAIWRASGGDREKATVGDCDEFAVYAGTCLAWMNKHGKANVDDIQLLTVNWFDQAGKFHGHNVCAFFDRPTGRWAHIGNWNNGRAVRGLDTLEDISKTITGSGTVIAWAVGAIDLHKLYQVQLH